MHKTLKKTIQSREILYKILTSLTNEELTKIPSGFNNNIYWNIAHTVVTQQLLMYKLSGLPMMIEEEMVNSYRKGTFPKEGLDLQEKKKVEELLFSTIAQAQKDVEADLFTDYTNYKTSIGVVLNDIEDAVTFNYYHEGLHIGYILALKKAIKV